MLALSRGEGQSIIIDGHIEVKIVKWSRSSVRLAIQAPRSVAVDRDEIWRKMNPGVLTPLEKAEQERRERFAQEGNAAPGGHRPPASPPGAGPHGYGNPPAPPTPPLAPRSEPPQGGGKPSGPTPSADDMDEPATGTGS
jgi:carbon storage regulator CsrA